MFWKGVLDDQTIFSAEFLCIVVLQIKILANFSYEQ